jgi:hypothetical protein|tara:strand:- start:975 stop:1088 length:114 start_codon:yes stop_codon:yes gene_type:complete
MPGHKMMKKAKGMRKGGKVKKAMKKTKYAKKGGKKKR